MSDRESTSLRVGTTLRGKWTLERILGEGGMASVYAARHKIGRIDAIKVMHPMYAAMPQLRARFEQEARAVNSFKHPGAVEIRDIDATEEGIPFLVMELLEGETLTAMARRGPVDAKTVLRVADDVLDVLAAAHAQGILHRDVKPDNLFMLKDGHVKVLDFGIARVKDSLPGDLKTKTGTTLGTVSYMPPEQARGMDIDERADIYAVGATMFRLLSRRHVHEAETEVERLMKVVSEPALPLATVASQIPAAVCSVVDRALAFDRDARYASASMMQSDVRAIARDEAPVYASKTPELAAKREVATRIEAGPAPGTPVEREPSLPALAPADPSPPPASRAETRAVRGLAQAVPTVVAESPVQAPGSSPVGTALVAFPAVSRDATRPAPGLAEVVPTVVSQPPPQALRQAPTVAVARAPGPEPTLRPRRGLGVPLACAFGVLVVALGLVWAFSARPVMGRAASPVAPTEPAGVNTNAPTLAQPMEPSQPASPMPASPSGAKPVPTPPPPPAPNPPPAPAPSHEPSHDPPPGHGKHHGR